MKEGVAAMVLASVLAVGFAMLVGDQVRGNKGQGQVNQWWVDSQADWHYEQGDK